MIDFFVRNLDAFIISTIFFILGFLPTILNPNKPKSNTIPSKSITVNNSNINGDINISDIRSTYNHNNEYKYNIRNTLVNHAPTTANNSLWELVIIFILLVIFMIFFYKYISRVLVYSIMITISSLLSSIFIYRKLIKISEYILLPNNIINISVRNITSWVLILINYVIIFYKINFSLVMRPFMNLINGISLSINDNLDFKLVRYILDNLYETFTASFIILSFILSVYLIFKLFLSYIWIISSINVSTDPNNKTWFKIYNGLNKRESKIQRKCWITVFIILFTLNTGLFAYVLTSIIRLTQYHRV